VGWSGSLVFQVIPKIWQQTWQLKSTLVLCTICFFILAISSGYEPSALDILSLDSTSVLRVINMFSDFESAQNIPAILPGF
jgi:hypothetical protein